MLWTNLLHVITGMIKVPLKQALCQLHSGMATIINNVVYTQTVVTMSSLRSY